MAPGWGAVSGVATVGAVCLRLLLKRRQAGAEGQGDDSSQDSAAPPRFLGHVSYAALKLLIQMQVMPYFLIQICDSNRGSSSSSDSLYPSLCLESESCLAKLKQPPDTWHELSRQNATSNDSTANISKPRQKELVCLVGHDVDVLSRAAGVLAAHGYDRVTITQVPDSTPSIQGIPQESSQGSIEELTPTNSTTSTANIRTLSPHGQPGDLSVDVQYMGRDAVAALLGRCNQQLNVPHILLDVRRHDERLLYGQIQESRHVPVEQLPSALAMSEEGFKDLYHFSKPQPGLPLVLCSRDSRRAVWAAQICADAGLWPVYVLRGGVCGWCLDGHVKQYPPYKVGDPPSEPVSVQIETPSQAQGIEELISAGLLPPPDHIMMPGQQ